MADFASGQHERVSHWQTPLEKVGGVRFSRSHEITVFLHDLAKSHSNASAETWGYSVSGKPLTALHIRKAVVPEQVSRLRVVLVGSQHGASEAAGAEALMVIARQLLHEDLSPLLDVMEFYLLPNANPDGRDRDSSKNTNEVNLNRDYVLLSQRESRALDQALARIQPHVVLDAHESAALKHKSLGLEGYMTEFDVQLDVANNPGVGQAIQQFCEQSILEPFLIKVQEGGLQAQRYIKEIGSTRQPLTHGGTTARVFRNKAGLCGALSFLLETRMDPKDGVYPTFRNIQVRRSKQIYCIRQFLQLIGERAEDIVSICKQHRENRLSPHCVLKADFVEHPHEPLTRLPLRRIDTQEVIEIEFVNHRHLRLHAPIARPSAYYIATHTERFTHLLRRHSIEFQRLEQDSCETLDVLSFTAIEEVPDGKVEVAVHSRKVLLPAGSLKIPLDQERGLLLPQLLEPQSTSSFFAYPEFRKLCLPQDVFFIYRSYA